MVPTMEIKLLPVLAAAYLIGSIPFGLIVARCWGTDIRRQGSGNIGATNVLRVLGPVPAGAVFILDMTKGTVPALAMQQLTADPWLIVLAGAAAILGHTFSVFLKFKGGRGAATGVGVLLGIAPDIFLGAILCFALILAITRIVSVSSMLTSLMAAIAFLALKRPFPYTIVMGLTAALIIVRHIPNIRRLLAGTEPRIGGKR